MDLMPEDGDLLRYLSENAASTARLIGNIPETKLKYRYAEGKWTIKETVGHIIDDERIYVYRALRFARNDTTELPGFDQDLFAKYSNADSRPIEDLLKEFAVVRQATIAFFSSVEDDALLRFGIGDGKRVSVRALGYHIAGHELHHVNIIKDRYLTS
jgi:uncharacterized damage-inducible protein DinB